MLRLLIISPTPHHKKKNNLVGHGATIKELSFLSRYFEITHIAPLYEGIAPESELPYTRPINFIPIIPGGGKGLKKVSLLKTIPKWLEQIDRILKKQDFDLIHIRTPSSFSLTSLIYFLKHREITTLKWIKFAGNWENNPAESFATRIQKRLLKKGVPNSFVTVNYFKNLPHNFVPFPNPSLYFSEYKKNIELSRCKKLVTPIIITYVGALNHEKGIMNALMVIRKLKESGISFRFLVAGNGPMEKEARNFVAENDLVKEVEFLGAIPHSRVFEIFKSSHFLLFPTHFNEGWPKVISEGMSMGTVPLAGRVSIIPEILEKYKIGHSIYSNDIERYVETIKDYLDNPQKWETHSANARKYAVFFTYEYYGLKLFKTLEKYGLNLPYDGEEFKEIERFIRGKEFPL